MRTITFRAALFLAPFCLGACVSQGVQFPLDDELTVTAEDAVRLLRKREIILIDTRSPHERTGRDISGSVAVQFGPVYWSGDVTEQERREFLKAIAEAGLTREHYLVTICNAGVRSPVAAKLLRAEGFTRVQSVAGGYIGSATDPGWQFAH